MNMVSLINKSKVNMNIIFRVFDEGVAFRYDFPKQAELNYFIISDEVTQFNLTDNHKVFWIPEILTVTNMNIMKPSFLI
jgi:hypothetical protein